MDQVEQLRELGYEVEQSQEVEGVPIWHVDGFGLATYVRDDDEDALASLVESHAGRLAEPEAKPADG